MDNLFLILFLISIICLIIGLIQPKIFSKIFKKKTNRKTIGLVFGSAMVLFFILFGITTPDAVEPKQTTNPQNVRGVSTQQTAEQKTEVKAIEFFNVTKIVDGDTIDVETIGRIRFIGIDTPETVDPRKTVQCFGKEASDKTKEMLTNKKVSLESDTVSGDKDSYGRSLRYVFLEDGTNFNKYMISEGYAHEYTYNSIPYKYQSDFKEAEKQARDTGKGLWASSTCNGDTIKAASDGQSKNTESVQIAPQAITQSTPALVTTPTPAPATSQNTSDPQVKKSNSGICHEKGVSQYYNQTKTFTSYNSIADCLASGGRLPK